MSRQQVALVTPVFPYPAYGGGTHYPYHLARTLSADFDVHLVFLEAQDDPIEQERLDHMAAFCKLHRVQAANKTGLRRALDFVLPHYFKGYSEAFRQSIEELAQICTVVHFDYLKSAEYVLAARIPRNVLKTYFTHNFEPELFERLIVAKSAGVTSAKHRISAKILKSREHAILGRMNRIFFICDRDRDLYRQRYGVEGIVTGNGVDTRAISYEPCFSKKRAIFIGNLVWGPNAIGLRWYFEEIYRDGLYPLLIVGFAQKNTDLRFIPHHPAIEIHRSPRSVLPFLRMASVSIVPLNEGSGTRGKILGLSGFPKDNWLMQ